MFQRIPVMIGQYRPLSSYMHDLDARVKIIPVIMLLTLILISSSTIFYITMIFFIAVCLAYSGVNSQIIKENGKPLLYFIAFTSTYHILFSGRDTGVLFSFSIFTLYKGAISSAFYYSLRLVLFLTSAFFITLTCSPSELADSITKLLRPLKVIKFPLSDFSLILFISLRFIPILYEEFLTIKNAQKVRGVNFNGSFITKILNLKSILIPLFLSAIRRADMLSESLLVRGYNSQANRTFYKTHFLKPIDIGFLISTSIVILISFYFIG